MSFCSSRFPRMFNPTLCRNLVWRGTLYFMEESSVFSGFLQNVKMTRLMANGDEVFVRAGSSMNQVSLKDAFRQDCCSVGVGSETSMSPLKHEPERSE